jgi:hypothetical protein
MLALNVALNNVLSFAALFCGVVLHNGRAS